MNKHAFEEQLADENQGYLCDFSSRSRILLVAFGGLLGKLNIAPYEFFSITRKYDCKKIYFRDLDRAWYQNGVRGLCSNMNKLSEHIQNIAKTENIEKITLFGCSMGGYAALLLGALTNAQEVHAFSPQTFIGPALRFFYMDLRWNEDIVKLYHTKPNTSFFDLKKVFSSASALDGRFCIYYSTRNRLDRVHAKRMSRFPNIELVSCPGKGHGLIGEMKRSGRLERILEDSFKNADWQSFTS